MITANFINQSLIFITALSIIFLISWVFSNNKRAKLNQIFVAWASLSLFWIIFGYLANSTTTAGLSLAYMKLRFGAVSLFYIFAYFFSIFIYQKAKRFILLDKFIIIISTIFAIISIFTNFIIENVSLAKWGVEIIFGKLAIIFYISITILTFSIVAILIKGYSTASKEEKLKVQYFLVGAFIFILMNLLFNVLFPILGTYKYYQFGDYSALVLFFFIAYAIVKRGLFGIKVILTALLVGIMTVLLMALPFFMPSNSLKILTGVVLFFFIIFGFLLIKSTYAEVKRKEEAESLLKAKTEFLSIASHQLRTPLTAIIGYSSMLKEGDYGTIPEKAGKAITHIYDSSQRMIKLVNDFLSVSRMETGKTILKIQETSMNELIGQVIAGLELRAKEKNLYLEYNRPTTDHIANIDPAKIKEVLSNLIDNAIHYTEKGGITVTVQKNGKITVIISDTGAGMTPEEIANLFESFSRGSAGNKLNTQGSGLGLYIAKKFVEMHNGEIHAASGGKDNGSTFYVELPGK
jgi:signal transduction histidine kinase